MIQCNKALRPFTELFCDEHGGKYVAALSGGEWTLLSILLAVESDGTCIMIDDIFEGVDSVKRRALAQIIVELSQAGISGLVVNRGWSFDDCAIVKRLIFCDRQIIEQS